MHHEILEKLTNFWGKTFFIEPILICLFTFCFIISVWRHHNQRVRLAFSVYFFIGLLLFVVSSFVLAFQIYRGRKLAIFSEVSNTIFELAEFIAFYSFFKTSIQGPMFQKVLTIFLNLLVVVIGIFFAALALPSYSIDYFKKHSLFINVLEFFFLAVMCLAYFYELFTSTPKINLFQRPSFFITTSLFFYSVLLIPFFMIAHYVFKNEWPFYRVLFACHFLLLAIMILTISKAFLCRRPITT